MTKETMKNKLLQKFSKLALEESCWHKSGGRTGDIDELEISELEKVYLMYFPAQKTSTELIYEQRQNDVLKGLRSIILKDAQYIGLYDPQDWTDFNRFMLTLSPLKKPLNQYLSDEFEVLKKQFKSLRGKYDAKAKVPYTKEWYHKNKLPMPSAN